MSCQNIRHAALIMALNEKKKEKKSTQSDFNLDGQMAVLFLTLGVLVNASHSIVWYRMVWFGIASHRIVSSGIISHHIVSYHIVWYRIVLQCIVSYHITL